MFQSRELNHKVNSLHETYSTRILPWHVIRRITAKTHFCLNTLQKYTSLDHRNVRGLQGDISKDFDGGPPTDSAFELYHETPT